MNIPAKPTVEDYQKYLRKVVVERGFDKETVPEVFILLIEEVGEWAKAIRKANGQKTDVKSQQHDVEEERLMFSLC